MEGDYFVVEALMEISRLKPIVYSSSSRTFNICSR